MSVPINFPDSPAQDENWLGPNGVLYKWDGVKWTLRVESDDLLNYWARNSVAQQLYPRNFDDEVLFDSLGIDYLDNLPT